MNDTDKRAIEEIPADAVIQALKCCASEEDNCHRCPFMGVGGISDICITAMSRAALDLIYRKQSAGEWISVEERLPETEGWYLVYTAPDKKHRSVNKAEFCKGFEWNNFEPYWRGAGGNWGNVTHWMPLPEPPDMKGGE